MRLASGITLWYPCRTLNGKMTTKNFIRLLFPAAAFFLMVLACRAVTSTFPPTTETPQTLPSTITPLPPSSTSLPPAPTSTPVINCANVMSNVLDSALPDGRAAEDLRGEPDGKEKNDFHPLVVYRVDGDQLTWSNNEPVPSDLVKFQEQKDVHQEIWDYYVKLIPSDQRSMLGEFIIITDGEQRLIAAVQKTDKDLYSWALEVDIVDISDPRELTYTLIHESAHLLTLNYRQVTPSRAMLDNPDDKQVYAHEALRCDEYFSNEGCSQADSYLNSFYNLFWVDIYDEWEKSRRYYDDELYYESLNDFYHKHREMFVTDYAVINPVEDIAESFSFFILSPKPSGDTISERKILFFYDYPELMKLRDEIQNRICALNP